MKNPIVYTTYTVGHPIVGSPQAGLSDISTKKYVAFYRLLVYNMILYCDADDWGA